MSSTRRNDPERPGWAAGGKGEGAERPRGPVAPRHVALPHKGPRKARRQQAARDRNDER